MKAQPKKIKYLNGPPYRIVIFQSSRKQAWFWHMVRQRGNKIVLDGGEGYKTHYGVVQAFHTIFGTLGCLVSPDTNLENVWYVQ